MAAEKMSWVAELFDKMSGPAKSISLSLGDMRAGLRNNVYWMQQQTKEQKMGTDALNKLGGTLGMAGAAVLATGAAFAALGYKIGEAAFSQFAFKESALATGKALWGSADAADAMFKQASQLAKLTPFNVGEVVTAFNKLGAAGFGAREVPVVFQGLSDIAAMSGRGADAIGQMTLAFSQIMGRGHLAGQELNQITEAAGGAVSRMKLFGEIGKIMGVATDRIDGMMTQGLIPARVAIMGVMQVAKQLGGGIIGQNSIEQSKTLGGLWANLEDTVTNLWLTMDLTKAPWFSAVKRFLAGLIEALDTSSRSGRVLQQVFENVFGKTVQAFIGNGSQDMTETIIGLARSFEKVATLAIAAFEGLWIGLKDGLKPLLQGLGLVQDNALDVAGMRVTFTGLGKSLATIVLGFTALAEVILTVLGPLEKLHRYTSLESTGGKIISGLALGMAGQMPLAQETLSEGSQGLINAVKEKFKVRSPSEVFEEIGENVVAGFSRGVEGLPAMNATLGTDLASGASRLAAGGGTNAGGRVAVNLTVNMNGNAGEQSDSIAQRIADVTTATLASFFDQLAAERGIA